MKLNEIETRKYNSMVLVRGGLGLLTVGGFSAASASPNRGLSTLALLAGILMIVFGHTLLLRVVASLEKHIHELEKPSPESVITRRDSVPSGGEVENRDAAEIDNDGGIL